LDKIIEYDFFYVSYVVYTPHPPGPLNLWSLYSIIDPIANIYIYINKNVHNIKN
jgi:hypothetical protein